MQISFSGKYALDPATFGINFEAIVDGSIVVCKVSTEALQDINPSDALGTAQDQFTSNRSAFERIAKEKIRNGKQAPIVITRADVLAWQIFQADAAPRPAEFRR
ncbi:DUF1488 family protein [Stenotrophomonas sp.]|uniref:DUF1488 family protein n=1 Tax=Stenotrophomonas sp. TaxID=69392 RepID=UPI00289C27F4|nr:DUF1488 family protein [Stenotrophomonas sp.]